MLPKSRSQNHKETNELKVPTETPKVLLVFDRFQKEPHITEQLIHMDCMDNGNAGVFITIVLAPGRVYEKTAIWGIVWETKEDEQARNSITTCFAYRRMRQSLCLVSWSY